MTQPNRLKQIPESEWSQEQARVVDALLAGRGKMPHPFKVWFHSPQLAVAWEGLGTFLHKKGKLTERDLELLICIIANHWKGDFVLAGHEKTNMGFSKGVFEAIRQGRSPQLEDPREQALCDFALISLQPGPGSDEVFARAEKLLGRAGIADALALLGYYSAVSMAMKLHRMSRQAL